MPENTPTTGIIITDSPLAADSPIAGQKGQLFFNDYLEFGDQLTEWKPFTHPQFGDVEIGGAFRKTFVRSRLSSALFSIPAELPRR